MTAQSTYRDVLMDDGSFVLYQVTTRLYQGFKLRPDEYFCRDSRLAQKNYSRIFNAQQRGVIERSGSEKGYDIKMGAKAFDVSLHALLIEHTCGLTTEDTLFRKVSEVRNLRNDVSHSVAPVCDSDDDCDYNMNTSSVTDVNLNQKLKELLQLYQGIINELEERTGDDLEIVKTEVSTRISNKMKAEVIQPPRIQMPDVIYPRSMAIVRRRDGDSSSGDETGNDLRLARRNTDILRSQLMENQPQRRYFNSEPFRQRTESRPSEMPAWGKVALGVTAGIAALGLVGAAATSASENERRRDAERRKHAANNNNEEQCVVM